MSVHPMPSNISAKCVTKIEVVPVTSKSVYYKQRPMWVAYIYCSLYEKPIHHTMECFTAGGATTVAEAWLHNNKYVLFDGTSVRKVP